MGEWQDFNPSEQDALRSGLALLRAGHRGEVDSINLILADCNVSETVQALTALALSFAAYAGVDIESYTAYAFADINEKDAA
ncbi:hypothetical protein [Nocardia flavorosea]|uniref:Uncharacterized protein n=1 Tax=Nocardia flavorosea TaxID=53429 RepID=A0A846YL79_9NOCA|nr:hypothetical protein [Nocardia flavorosea]NKY60396.1 hypothetical protein [Nocardia flavorosea]